MQPVSKNASFGSNGKSFPVVAIGASSGGVEAMIELLKALPNNTGMAYVYIQHLDPSHESRLVEIFQRQTEMPVKHAEDEMEVQVNHLHIILPNTELTVVDGHFKVVPRPHGYAHLPINAFFLSLAEHYQDFAVGVVLSGADSDGTVGLKAIKSGGGLTFGQDESAKFQSMPRSAQAEGAVDLMLSPKEIAEELAKLGKQKELYYEALKELNEETISKSDEDLAGVLHLLHRSAGVDFNQYKMNTIKRRIIRRMMLFKLETLKDYAQYIRQNAGEVNLLYQDLLIHVTTFFRDAESADYLKKNLLPKIIRDKGVNDPIRVWVPACSTGQEAYSLAMLIVETLGDLGATIPVQIFATDLSESAINKARVGMYTRDEVAEIPPKRLARFFNKSDGHFRIIKSIRDLCVFATHNIAKDPPFSRMDIVSCCNLLIYLDSQLQKKIIATFHYSLQHHGFLILGKSETVGTSAYLFAQVEKKFKIYSKKKDTTSKAMFEMNYSVKDTERPAAFGRKTNASQLKSEEVDLEKSVDSLLLKKFTPASVLINEELDILQFRGSTGLFLEPTPGKASLNLMRMAKTGLSFELRNIVHKAKKTGEATKKEGLEILREGKPHRISVEAIPVKGDGDDVYFLVVFEEMPKPKEDAGAGSTADRRVKQVETELTALREDMRSIIESQEAANEELQSANEEIVSSNEELQSINEELETSKEEIESSNEELITINQELQVRNDQLAEAQEYAQAVVTTIRESLVILDHNLRVKSANDSFYKTFGVNEEETEGRLIFDLGNRQWNIPKLRELLEEILPNNSQFSGFEVRHNLMGIGEKVMLLNARRIIQKLHGQPLILLAIEDVTYQRQAEKITADREAWFRHMADNVPAMMWVTGIDKLCTFVNESFLDFKGLTLEQAIGQPWYGGVHPDDQEHCANTYDQCFKERKAFKLTYRAQHKDRTYRNILVQAKPTFTTEALFTGYVGSCVELPGA